MGDDEDLRLNTVDRFRKRSLKLVLEEHGHCEVPAGCGGVVLRWTDPAAGIPVRIWCYAPGEATLFIDGEEPTSGRPILSFGTHELTLDVEPPFLFAAADDEFRDERAPFGVPPPERMVLLSTPDGRWEYTTGEGWGPLIRADVQEPERYGRGAYAYRELIEMGAVGLGPSGDRTAMRIRVRRKFEIRRA